MKISAQQATIQRGKYLGRDAIWWSTTRQITSFAAGLSRRDRLPRLRLRILPRGAAVPSSSGSAAMKRPRDIADRSRELRDLRRLDRDGFLRETFTLPVEDARARSCGHLSHP